MAEINNWTEEMDSAVLKAKAEGATTREIALIVGVSHGALRYRLACLRQQGHVPGSLQIKWTPEMNKALLDGRAAGKSYKDLVDVIGKCISSTSARTQFYRLTGKESGSTIRKPAIDSSIATKTCYCCRKQFKPTQKGLFKCDYCKRNNHDQSCYELGMLTGSMPAKLKNRVLA